MPSLKQTIGLLMLLTLMLSANTAAASECIVLLHGLWRSEASMNKMEHSLSDAGYEVRNIAYESTESTVEDLAEETIPRAVKACEGTEVTHFVTHSMGGILLRQFLESGDINHLGRVVMLGPPNQGTEVVDVYGKFPGFKWIGGPAGLQLGTGEASIPRSLGPVNVDVGVIAGTRSINPILSAVIPDADDGKVSVESTRVEGMTDHLEMPVNHMFMMRNKEVIRQVIYYLRNGQFLHDQD